MIRNYGSRVLPKILAARRVADLDFSEKFLFFVLPHIIQSFSLNFDTMIERIRKSVKNTTKSSLKSQKNFSLKKE